MPVLVDENGTILAGHARVLAARKLGLTEVPVIVARGWSEAQKRAYVIADNKLTINSGWDEELLRIELADLKLEEFNLGLLGFDDTELERILNARSGGASDPDDVPGVPDDPLTRVGDLWSLGWHHYLLCGDATIRHDVERLLGEARPHLMIVDPPYGTNYDPTWRIGMRRANGSIVGAGAIGKVNNDDRADWYEAWALFPGDVVYQWHAGLHASDTQHALEKAGFEVRAQIIWAKQQFVIGRGHYHVQHEPCWYAVRKGASGHWNGDQSQSTI